MPLINRTGLSVPVIVQSRTGVTPAAAFEIIVPIDLSLTFRGWGPFPAVLGAKNQTGSWDHVGASRNPDLSDGQHWGSQGGQFTLDDRPVAVDLVQPR